MAANAISMDFSDSNPSSTGESNMSVDTDTDFRDSQCNRSTQVNSNSVHTTAKNYDRVPRSGIGYTSSLHLDKSDLSILSM